MSKGFESDITIFTNGNLFSRIILEEFLKNYTSRIAVVVIISGDYYGNKGLKALFNFSRVTSWVYVFYKIWTILMIKLLRIGNRSSITSVDQLCDHLTIPIIRVADINEEFLFEKIKALNPTYLVSVSCPQLIRKKWLQLVDGKGINIHSSLLPQYGGLAPYFWVLANGEKETGITVHYLIKGFDKGNILSQVRINIEKGISSFMLFLKLCIQGQVILAEAFNKMEKGDLGVEQDHKKFTYYSHPTSSAYITIKKKGFSLFNLRDFNFTSNYIKNINFK